MNPTTASPVLSSSTISGDKVVNRNGDDLGDIKDLMIDVDNGRVAYAVLEFGGIFGPAGRAEVPLVGTVGGRTISAQVDRLVVTPDAVLVVDFKTNRPPPTEASAVPVVYLRQMAAYRQALGRIYPDRPIRCALLWTDGPRLMPLADALLDAHAP